MNSISNQIQFNNTFSKKVRTEKKVGTSARGFRKSLPKLNIHAEAPPENAEKAKIKPAKLPQSLEKNQQTKKQTP